MADEWLEIVNRLWTSWEPDAVVADPETGVFADHTKIHPINYAGRFYKSRGPLNTAPGPQRRPVICQAGGSPAGRAFAAKHADLIIAKERSVAGAKKYRQDITRLLASHGPQPSGCKGPFNTSGVIGETIAEARYNRALMTPAL